MRVSRLMLVPALMLAAGCMKGQRVVKVNADGSGTIVDTITLGEQAKGMLMERYGISADLAFGILVRAAQDSSRGVRDVAARLIVTGEAPDPPPGLLPMP